MDIAIASYISAGGVSGAVVCVFYFAYKCLYKKKIHSECCGNTVDVKADQPSPKQDDKKDIKLEVI